MSASQNIIFNRKVQLEKFPGKGGWTYVPLDIPLDGKRSFGFKKVDGFIDDYELKNYTLMPMGNGTVFLAVKAEIRKKIKKESGDSVNLVLYADMPLEVPEGMPEDFILCLQDEPEAWKNFQLFSENEKREYVNWIYSAPNEDELVNRMAKAVDEIAMGIAKNKSC